ncbi:MAG: hypothetical protein VX642_08135 [Bdellovibrionota bacterium]|nr:hypothetical protein [Bdellovibrionota bacterium]
MKLETPEANEKSPEKDYSIYALSGVKEPNIVFPKPWIKTNGSQITRMFWLGHELSHMADQPNKLTKQCLINQGFTPPLKDRSTEGLIYERIFDYERLEKSTKLSTRQMVKWLVTYNNRLENLDQIKEIRNSDLKEQIFQDYARSIIALEFNAKEIKRSWNKLKDSRENPFPIERVFTTIKHLPLNELSKLIDDKSPDLANQLKTIAQSGNESSGGGFEFGEAGKIKKMIDEWESNNNSERISKYSKRLKTYNSYPSQTEEALCDLRAIKLAVKSLKNSSMSAEDKRKAAQAILFSLPPHPYTGETERLMNKIGAKKLNQNRVFELLLSNPEFREILGCEFKFMPTPPHCLK